MSGRDGDEHGPTTSDVTLDRVPWAAIGPGLLWAGTAIGVSHLVQSTRAGAGFGLSLLWLVLLANLMKYPAFEAGPRYAAATGHTLLEGYRRRGLAVIWCFIGLTVATMCTVLAGVTIVTAGMASALVSDALSVASWSAVLLASAVAMLLIGRFVWLERFMKLMMLVLGVSTLLSVLVVVPSVDWARIAWQQRLPDLSNSNLIFVAALVGWMPSAIDTAVWQSQWGLEKQRTEGIAYTPRGASLDFNVGYFGTALLACCFVFLGATILHGTEQPIPSSSAAFAAMLVDVYGAALGVWARPLILIAAFATMLSTTVAIADGFPRALDGAVARLRTAETGPVALGRVYPAVMVGNAIVAWLIIASFTGSLTALVDFATVLTGITAPGLALLNLAVLRGDEVPAQSRPRGAMLAFHVLGIAFLSFMAGLAVALHASALWAH